MAKTLYRKEVLTGKIEKLLGQLKEELRNTEPSTYSSLLINSLSSLRELKEYLER